jgi:LSD1 subclass zinc finger protein
MPFSRWCLWQGVGDSLTEGEATLSQGGIDARAAALLAVKRRSKPAAHIVAAFLDVAAPLCTMAGLMQWFQVTCPNCTAALQVRLPEGVTSVQCSQCKAVFAVQVQPIALSSSGQAPPTKRSRKRKAADKSGGAIPGDGSQPRTLSAYNVFMKGEVAKVKTEHPELPHREAFKLVRTRALAPAGCTLPGG